MALGVTRSPINVKSSGGPKCLQGRGLGQISKETSAWACICWGVCYNRGMNSKIITLAILAVIVGLVIILPGEDTIKPSKKEKALKSQGILLGALAILGIF